MPADYGARTHSQRLWLAAAAGLLTVLIVGGGWLAWRALSHVPPSVASSPPGHTLAIDATEVGFGAPLLVEGVPWGFPLTPEGAAAAAVSAVSVTGQPDVVFDAGRFDEVAAVVFSPDQAQLQAEQVAAARTQLQVSGWADQPASRRTYFFAPLAVRLAAYHPAGVSGPAATVEVWSVTLVGVGDAGGAVFTTSTVELAPDGSGDTWIIVALDSVEGPTPLVAGTASPPGRTRGFLRDAVATVPLPLPGGQQP